MLRRDRLRVSRTGDSYRPRFVGRGGQPLAARVLRTFIEHVGARRSTLDAALAELEADSQDFKLVRGLADIVERDCVFETRAPVPPERVRRRVFETAATVGVVSEVEREGVLAEVANDLGVTVADVEASLYADRDCNAVLVDANVQWDPTSLITQYDLSVAQTALFDATCIRIRSNDPKRLVSAVKRLRLMYEVERTPEGRELVVTGPDALFTGTRRYGTAFARLLRTVAGTAEWQLTATIDDRGRERRMTLTHEDVSVPGVDPLVEPTFDSGVEADFAGRFRALDLDWTLVREPEPLAAGTTVLIPDFAFEYDHAPFRLFFEVMGFWTPEYVETKLAKLAAVEDVDLLVAVDESLGVGEEVADRDHRVIAYSGTVRLKDVVDVLNECEGELVADAMATLPEKLVPDADVTTLAAVADSHDVSVDAVESVRFPEHERVGQTLVRPAVLADVAGKLSPELSLSSATSILEEYGLTEASATLSRLGYRVAWAGLEGGTLHRTDDDTGTDSSELDALKVDCLKSDDSEADST